MLRLVFGLNMFLCVDTKYPLSFLARCSLPIFMSDEGHWSIVFPGCACPRHFEDPIEGREARERKTNFALEGMRYESSKGSARGFTQQSKRSLGGIWSKPHNLTDRPLFLVKKSIDFSSRNKQGAAKGFLRRLVSCD